MVVYDFDVGRACGVLGPLEANPPLHVDADVVLSCPIAFEGLKAVAGEAPQILKTRRGVQNFETLVRLPVETLKLPDKFAARKSFGPLRSQYVDFGSSSIPVLQRPACSGAECQ